MARSKVEGRPDQSLELGAFAPSRFGGGLNLERALIIGGTSRIARATALLLARGGASLHLMGRDIEELERTARDVEVRTGARVTCGLFEAERWQTHSRALEAASGELNGIDVAILAAGELGDQELAARDFDTALSVINTNYVAAVSVLTWLGGYMEERRSGSIVCLTSVAGDRGRPSNFVYGSAKGALALYLQGLRGRLWRSNVHVMTAKLGFVDTKMTYGRKGMFLVASPEAAAASIVRGLRARRDIIYVPGFWRPLMSIIEAVPEPLFKRLPL